MGRMYGRSKDLEKKYLTDFVLDNSYLSVCNELLLLLPFFQSFGYFAHQLLIVAIHKIDCAKEIQFLSSFLIRKD